jgi:HAMP domain-containing protein
MKLRDEVGNLAAAFGSMAANLVFPPSEVARR